MLKDSIGYRASLAATTLKSRFAKLLSPQGIAPEQFATLKIISEDNEVTQTRIAELLAKNKTTVGRSIDALVQKGLIDRQDIENDRRANLITLTAKGEEVLRLAIPIAQKFNETVKSKFDQKEIETFFKVLDLIIELSQDTKIDKGNIDEVI
jgi:DNA-binding MarR family transcriptional regulator